MFFPFRTKVRLGEHDISKKRDCQGQGQNQVCSPDPIDAPVEEIIVHPNYKSNDKSQYDDIALIRLRSNIQMSCKYLKSIYPAGFPDLLKALENIKGC